MHSDIIYLLAILILTTCSFSFTLDQRGQFTEMDSDLSSPEKSFCLLKEYSNSDEEKEEEEEEENENEEDDCYDEHKSLELSNSKRNAYQSRNRRVSVCKPIF